MKKTFVAAIFLVFIISVTVFAQTARWAEVNVASQARQGISIYVSATNERHAEGLATIEFERTTNTRAIFVRWLTNAEYQQIQQQKQQVERQKQQEEQQRLAEKQRQEQEKQQRDMANQHYTQGFLFSLDGKYDSAIAEFTEAIRLWPNRAEFYFYRGNMHYNKKDWDRVIADYEAALRIEPNHSANTSMKEKIEEARRQRGR